MAPSRPGGPRRVFAILTVLAFAAGGCGSATVTPVARPSPSTTLEATPTVVATPEATHASEPTPAATEEVAQSADANTFVSPRYKYAITLPPGSLVVGWHAADRAWDGQAKLETGGPYLDRASTAEGGIHMYGAPSTSLDEWFGVVEGAGIRFHGCTEAQNRREASVGGAPAIAFTQSCNNNIETWARVAIFKDGYGVAMWLHPTPGAEVATRDKALELLEGLEWPLQ